MSFLAIECQYPFTVLWDYFLIAILESPAATYQAGISSCQRLNQDIPFLVN